MQHSLRPGGMENGVVNVANALHPRGFEFHVACLSTSGDFAARLPDPNLVHPLEKPEGFSWSTVRQLRQLIREVRPHVVHSHNLGALIYAACATRFGTTHPILHGEHGTPDDGPDARRRQFQRKLLFKATRKVHTVSHSLHDAFLKAGFPASKLVALVNGVDVRHYLPGDPGEARRRLGIPDDSPVLLIVGRLASSKRHLLLFEALEEVVSSFPNVLLLVTGDGGDHADEIRAAATSGKASAHIRMEGFQKDLRDHYQASDLLVAPSRVEGLSNAVLEAMACGLPALLDEACGNSDVITDGIEGCIREIHSAGGLAQAIVTLLADRERLKAMGARARARVTSDFSLERMAEAYETTYRQLAEQAG